jgi:hypothetical protein
MRVSYSTVCVQFGKRIQQVVQKICEVVSNKRLKIRKAIGTNHRLADRLTLKGTRRTD